MDTISKIAKKAKVPIELAQKFDDLMSTKYSAFTGDPIILWSKLRTELNINGKELFRLLKAAEEI